VLKGRISRSQADNWIQALEPSTPVSDILIREEYYEALKAVADHYQSGRYEFPTDEEICENPLRLRSDGFPLPFANPLNALVGEAGANKRGFILIGHPGIGKPTCLLSCGIY